MKLILENWRQYIKEDKDWVTNLIIDLKAMDPKDEDTQDWSGNLISMLKAYKKMKPEKAEQYLQGIKNSKYWKGYIADKILEKESEFDILGHGTNMKSANSILSNGFRIDRDLNKTFLRVDRQTIITQLTEWPYGERGSGPTGVVFMMIPKGQLETEDLKDKISVEAEGTVAIQDPELGAIGGAGKRVIPPYFFFAVWDEDTQELSFNPKYDEGEIYNKFQLDEPATTPGEEEPEALPADDDIF